MHPDDCPLCSGAGGLMIASTPRWRVVRVTDTPAFPAFYRLIWNRHIAEFSELGAAERADCMEGVARIEAALRTALRPAKINLASLGNVVPHLHWHLVARFEWDSHFPNPIWGEARRPAVDPLARLALPLDALDAQVAAAALAGG